MTNDIVSGGVFHKVPIDLRELLTSDSEMLRAWEGLTPIARNEWICWTISVKKIETRKWHLERAREELKAGICRPCCWYGCIYRPDKAVSPSVQNLVINKSARNNTSRKAA